MLPAVALIWGLIFYRILQHIHKSQNTGNSLYNTFMAPAKDTLNKTFQIKADYRDPFAVPVYIKTEKTPEVKPAQSKGTIHRRVVKRENSINWPEIAFGGLIYNEKTGKKTALIMISQKNYLLNPGETRQDIVLNKMFTDSILVTYKDEKKTLYKTKNMNTP